MAGLRFFPTVVHVPHSSVTIPRGLRDQFILTQLELDRELLHMTDRYTDELFALPKAMTTTVIYPVSRLVVDPERFLDNQSEPMAAKGMGVVYTKTSDQRPLRRPISRAEREALVSEYYVPHHRKLNAAVARALSSSGKCLIIDAHSFPSAPLPYENDQGPERPAICIGKDEYHTPAELERAAVEAFRREFDRVAVNRPFSGALVPDDYYRKDKRVRAIMIEVNRSLYMDEATGQKSAGFGEVKALIRRALRGIMHA